MCVLFHFIMSILDQSSSVWCFSIDSLSTWALCPIIYKFSKALHYMYI